MKRIMLALLLMTFSTFSFAAHCPADAKAIDEGLAKANLADDVRANIVSLRDKGMSEHEAGDHGSAVTTLSEAMRLLLTNME